MTAERMHDVAAIFKLTSRQSPINGGIQRRTILEDGFSTGSGSYFIEATVVMVLSHDDTSNKSLPAFNETAPEKNHC